MPKQPIQVPGDPKAGITALNNTSGPAADPNAVALDREKHLRLIAAASGATDIAPGPAIGQGPAIAERTIGGDRVRVIVPDVKFDQQVQKFGVELPFPRGTLLGADRTPVEGDAKPVYVVGDVLTDEGTLVHRAIPLVDEEAA